MVDSLRKKTPEYIIELHVEEDSIISSKELLNGFTSLALIAKENSYVEYAGKNFLITLDTFKNFSGGQFLVDQEPFLESLKEKTSEKEH